MLVFYAKTCGLASHYLILLDTHTTRLNYAIEGSSDNDS